MSRPRILGVPADPITFEADVFQNRGMDCWPMMAYIRFARSIRIYHDGAA